MKKTTKKIIWLGAKEVLLTLFDLSLPFFYAFFFDDPLPNQTFATFAFIKYIRI